MSRDLKPNHSRYATLPPLSTGISYGNLTVKIGHILWFKKPNDVIILCSWWGETEVATFEPDEVKRRSREIRPENIFIYDIKTNLKLFKAYLKDCESLQFVAIHKYFGTVVGSTTVKDLSVIVYRNPFQSYFPIVDVSGTKLGELHISFTLQHSELTNFGGDRTAKSEHLVGNICDKPPLHSSGVSCDIAAISERNCRFNCKQSNNVHANCEKKQSINILNPEYKSGSSFHSVQKNDLVVQILKQGQSLQDAMVRSILEDGDLLMLENTNSRNKKALYKGCAPLSSYSEANSNIMDYLSGKELSPKEESEVLSALCSVSHIDNLLEVADDFMKLDMRKDNLNGGKDSGESADYYTAVQDIDYECKENYFDKRTENLIKHTGFMSNNGSSFGKDGKKVTHTQSAIDQAKAFRIAVHKLTIFPGKALNLMNTRATYFTEFELPALLVSNSNGVLGNHQPIPLCHKTRFCSRKFEGNAIQFERSSTFKITSKKKTFKEKFKSLHLKFNVYSRNLTQKNPLYVGCADLFCGPLTSVENLKNQYKLNVTYSYSNSKETIGALSVSVEFIPEDYEKRHQFQHNTDKRKVIDNKISDLSSNIMYSATSFSSRGENSVTTSPCLASNKTIERQSHSANVPSATNSGHLGENNNRSGRNDPQQEDGKTNKNTITQKKVLLHALLYISEGRGFGVITSFLKCRTFWKEDVSVSNVCWQTDTPQYNFYELIPVLLNDELLQRCQNNVMVTEVWGNDQLVGLAKLPLAPFYTAFRQPAVAEQLLSTKYPVISVDGWINVVNPTSGVPVGQLNVFLALGTEDQVHLIEDSRSLHNTHKSHVLSVGLQASDCTSVINAEANAFKKCLTNNELPREQFHHQNTTQNKQDLVNITESLSFANLPDSQSADLSIDNSTQFFSEEKNGVLHESGASLKNDLKNICNSVGTQNLTCNPQLLELENNEQVMNALAQKVTINSEGSRKDTKQNIDYGQYDRNDDTHSLSNIQLNCKSLLSECDVHSQSQSDSAVVTVCSKREPKGSSHKKYKSKKSNKSSGVSTQTELKHTTEKCFYAHVEIVNALNLQVKTHGKATILPSTYVTMDVVNPNLPNNSNQLLQTFVIWHSVNPVWEWKQDIWLSSEYLIDKNKRLIFKVWQKSEKPNKDTVIGFVPIDLTVLLYGMPWISGWFNISNFSGSCVGQIKINISPLESLTRFTIQHLSEDNQKKNNFMDCHSDQSKMSHHKTGLRQDCSMNSNSCTNAVTCDTADVSMSFLSNALKRKLSELDEITQRLKQRLDSVTQEDIIATVDNPWLHEDDPLFKSLDNDFVQLPSTSKSSGPSRKSSAFNKGIKLKESSETQTLNLVPSRLHVNNLSDHANSSFVQDLQQVIEKDGESVSKSSVHDCESLQSSSDNSLSHIENKLKDIDMDGTEGDNDNIYALTDYFMEMASQKFEIENVFNPLLFQHILRFPSDTQGHEFESGAKQSSENIQSTLSHSNLIPENPSIETSLSEENTHRQSTEYWGRKAGSLLSYNNTDDKINLFKAGELPVKSTQNETFTSQETSELSTHVNDGEDFNSSSSVFTERYVSSGNSPHGSVSEMSYSNSSILEVPRLAPEGGNTIDGSSQNVNKCPSPKERKQD